MNNMNNIPCSNENQEHDSTMIANHNLDDHTQIHVQHNTLNVTVNYENIQTTKDENTNIKIILWNIRGINDKIFCPNTQKLLFDHDLIILTETHTDQSSQKEYNKIPGFIFKDFPRKYKHPRAPGNSGGIGIFINCKIAEGIDLNCNDECIVWLKLKSTFFGWDRDKLIACIYFFQIRS